ncbi:MAG: MerR family transcriptional regulator [Hylemonella sp.]|nr:MerR family transcriptional regulator [Hylemonella sp.]
MLNPPCESLENHCFTVEEMARSCGVQPDWIRDCVSAGVLQVEFGFNEMCFSTLTLVRVRRLVQLEAIFDADLQLAAMTVDLMEEVNRLRSRLELAGHHDQ